MKTLPLFITLFLCACMSCTGKTGSNLTNEQNKKSAIKINLDKTNEVAFKDFFSQMHI